MRKYKYIIIAMLVFLSACTIHNKSEPFSFIEASSGILVQDDTIIFPEPTRLIEVNISIDEDLPTSKDEGSKEVMLSFNVDGVNLITYGRIKVQGSSTAYWPKKNWSLSFFSDEERTNELKVKIGNSIASNKWITKADWIDPSQLRNYLSYKLWEGMVKSRNTFPQYEVDNAWLGNNDMNFGTPRGAQGFPKTHISQVKVNDEHYGISLLILGHDPDNFNVNVDNQNHIYMEFDARGGADKSKNWSKFSKEGVGTWINSYYPKNENLTNKQLNAIDDLGDFINGDQAIFKRDFEKYFDKTNMIDMLLLLEIIHDNDSVAQDIEIATYDLKKWYFLPWDKDTTFDMYFDGSGLSSSGLNKTIIDYKKEQSHQKPWYKTYHAFTDEVEARYAQLRDENVFTVINLSKLAFDINGKISKTIWEAERERWPDRPSMDETSTAQILSWFKKRLELLDNHFNYESKK